MLTGYNTDIQHDGKTFHVQTEDKGAENPMIESLIYVGGQILDARRQSYADRLAAGMTPEQIAVLMERQHQTIVRDIRLGKFDPPERRHRFGEGVVTDRPLDVVIKDFIEAAAVDGTLPPPPRATGKGGK
jgi:hypothetical protein